MKEKVAMINIKKHIDLDANRAPREFKEDFQELFTEEKLIELVTITIGSLYPEKNTEEIYSAICTEYNIDIAGLDIASIETKIQNYYL